MTHGTSKILNTTPLKTDQFKWVSLQAIEWQDPTGRQRKWETAERTTRKGDVDAIAILTLITRPSSRDDPQVLLVSQFRPPVKLSEGDKTTGLTLELPAGLVDGQESPKDAGLRELKEETGYGDEGATVLETSLVMNSDPGASTANMCLLSVKIDLPSDDSQDPVAQPDEGEFIEKHLIPVKGLYKELKRLQAEEKYAVDARLMHLAYGLELRTLFGLDGSKGKM
ncbi:unnamed protein product [Jaminaea pallidilutea]